MSSSNRTHENFHRSHEVKESSDRTFGVVFAVVFLIVALWPLRNDPTAWQLITWWALAVAVVIAAFAFTRPALLRPANQLWLKFGLLLNRVVNPIVMAVLFFGVVTPYGVIMRLAGKDPMRRKFDASTRSYWLAHESKTTSTTMKNQF